MSFRYIYIAWMLFLGIQAGYAQDTLHLFNPLKEKISPLVSLRDVFYESPALRSYQREYNFSELSATYADQHNDLYLQQEGSGGSGLQLNARSYGKDKNANPIWGNAYYRNDKIYKVNYNETNDYALLYPYVMADTVGGDLNSEVYYFSGGYAHRLKSVQLGFSGSFKGQQAYRDRDPRPKNISTEVQAALSASKPLTNRYALALDVMGSKYHQNNSLSFVNELGYPLVYHEAGLGVYNALLAGTRTQAYYNGTTWGTQVHYVPINSVGWIAKVSFKRFDFNKLIGTIEDAVSEVSDKTWEVSGGYLGESNGQRYMLIATAADNTRSGTEAKFDNRDSEHGIYKISEDVRFQNKVRSAAVNAVYGRVNTGFDWYAGIQVGASRNRMEYAAPDRFMNYDRLEAGLQVTGIKSLHQTLFTAGIRVFKFQNLSSDYRWDDARQNSGIYTMLTNNYHYLTANQLRFAANLRADFPFSAKLNFYVAAGGEYTRYTSASNGSQWQLTTGFIF